MNRTGFAVTILVLTLSTLPAGAESESPQITPPDAGVRFGNIFLPGLLQTANGQTEGYWYMAGGPLMIAGTGLEIDYALNAGDPGRQWELGVGLPAAEIGVALEAYSLYAFERDFRNQYAAPEDRKPREPLLDLLFAPFDPSNLFDPGVISVLGLLVVPSFTYDGVVAMGDYFNRPTVSFFGATVSPGAGLALETAFALVLNLFVATAEEVLFRGIVLDTSGPWASALTFGALHLGNVFISLTPGVTALSPRQIAGVVQQSVFALSFGVYANILTENDGDRLGKPIAVHYWNNVFSMVLGYLAGEGVGGP